MIMKRILITLIIALVRISLSAKDFQVRGPQGGLSMKLKTVVELVVDFFK